MNFELFQQDEDITEAELLGLIKKLNENDSIS